MLPADTAVVRAREFVLALVELALGDYYSPDADPIPVSDDAGSFHPDPLGVLIGIPSLTGRTMRARTYVVPVHVVIAAPLNTRISTEALLALADALVEPLDAVTYTPTDWSGGVNIDPLPSVLMQTTVTVTEEPPDATD